MIKNVTKENQNINHSDSKSLELVEVTCCEIYGRKCKCEAAKKKRADKAKEYRTRGPSPNSKHGIISTYNIGCRCDLCKEIKRIKSAKRDNKFKVPKKVVDQYLEKNEALLKFLSLNELG